MKPSLSIQIIRYISGWVLLSIFVLRNTSLTLLDVILLFCSASYLFDYYTKSTWGSE